MTQRDARERRAVAGGATRERGAPRLLVARLLVRIARLEAEQPSDPPSRSRDCMAGGARHSRDAGRVGESARLYLACYAPGRMTRRQRRSFRSRAFPTWDERRP